MDDAEQHTQVRTRLTIHRLVRETGISVIQATELVSLLGLNWSSLIREARLIRKG